MKRRNALHALAALPVAASLPALAQAPTKIVFGYTAVTDFASVFVAAEEGYFKQAWAGRGAQVHSDQLHDSRQPSSRIRCRSAGPRPACSCRRWTAGWTTWW
jgi:hypothetical protein